MLRHVFRAILFCAAVSLLASAWAADFVQGAVLPDGQWWQERIDPRSGLVFSVRRMLPLPFEEKALHKLLLAEYPDARDLSIENHPALSAKTTYPSRRFEYLAGENEDTTYHQGAVVYCDDWTFQFTIAAHADSLHPESDPAISEADLEAMLLNLDFLSFDAPPRLDAAKVYADPERLEHEGNAVMNALLRIKQEANPEAGLEAERGSLAYRYDGVAMISAHGLAIHQFAFGTDLPEKFTAERHFGVARDGTVYEMDIPAGGLYEEIEGQRQAQDRKVPGWWGDYANGGKTVTISNFREGLDHYYFHVVFRSDGQDVGDGFTRVDDRQAYYCGLIFELGEDDNTLRISREDDFDLGGEAWLLDFVGDYRRADADVETNGSGTAQ